MKIDNLSGISGNLILSSDVCIVGSGPAGLTLAAELGRSGLKVLVIESGDREREDSASSALNTVENVGEGRILDQAKLRNRIFGGSSHSWSGRCTTLDDIDYEARDWVPGSGWPITAADVAPFMDRAARHLSLRPVSYDDALLPPIGLVRPFADPKGVADIRSIFWQFSRDPEAGFDFVRFGPRFLKAPPPNVSIVTNATVAAIETTERADHVSALTIKTSAGTTHKASARLFVLCAGGIENPRLLLSSNAIDPQGVGNAKGLVGRYLMDHPRTLVGTFAKGAESEILAEFGVRSDASGARMQRGLSLSPQAQEREKLLNCAAWAVYDFAPDDVWSALREARRLDRSNALGRTWLAARHADQVAAGVWARYVKGRPLPRRVKQVDLHVTLEQAPDANSRVTLSDQTDAFGIPRAKIDWKISAMERRTAMILGRSINAALDASKLSKARLVDWVEQGRPEDATFFDVAHPTGTTRMADTAAAGVVDPDCKVFGVDNLYVAGSSVFPTNGHANPTLMILALSLRLADTLRIRAQSFAQSVKVKMPAA